MIYNDLFITNLMKICQLFNQNEKNEDKIKRKGKFFQKVREFSWKVWNVQRKFVNFRKTWRAGGGFENYLEKILKRSWWWRGERAETKSFSVNGLEEIERHLENDPRELWSEVKSIPSQWKGCAERKMCFAISITQFSILSQDVWNVECSRGTLFL